MNAFVRQLAVLSVLWSVCELLLPEGRQQQMVRAAVGVLVMTALLGTMGRILSGSMEIPAWSAQIAETGTYRYRQTALTAMANQIETCCTHMAQRAGYQARTAVWLTQEGALERIEMMLAAGSAPLVTQRELRSQLAQLLEIDPEKIRLSEGS